ncbi:IclR family transcriptional regulator [Glutamicibacter sp.]|uniref:IclR family transcriptional regulator n=1 Tax=Glutamicibacter sp. TaxID=1931995 RepID=UPI0028BDB951|nr:IclR family transcriptional regulator [Glutamicibacter sp.]
MQFKKFRRKQPAYPIESVDNALALIELLRDFGAIRLSDAALQLGISRSTAHRLMAMLVYRGFAEQDSKQRYIPGPSLGVAPAGISWTAELRTRVLPHLQKLNKEIDETVNLMVLAGTQVRFLASVQGSRPLRVGDRQGEVMPASATSAGKAMLAQLDAQSVEDLYAREARINQTPFSQTWFLALANELKTARKMGFALNLEESEAGINALGVVIRDRWNHGIAGISVSIPPSRFREAFELGLPAAVFAARKAIEEELRDFEVEDSEGTQM